MLPVFNAASDDSSLSLWCTQHTQLDASAASWSDSESNHQQDCLCLSTLRGLAVLWPCPSAIVRFDFSLCCLCLAKLEWTTSARAEITLGAAALTPKTPAASESARTPAVRRGSSGNRANHTWPTGTTAGAPGRHHPNAGLIQIYIWLWDFQSIIVVASREENEFRPHLASTGPV